MKRRQCRRCGRNRAERFFKSARARVCSYCQRDTRRQNNRSKHLRDTYGITEDEYDELLRAQGGGCAICGRQPSYNLQVDHNHKTGAIRGLLCKPCNRRLLPSARDNTEILENAVFYLTSPPAERVIGTRIVPGGAD